MTICEIVREYLVSHGYDGLASSEDWDGCGCGVGDLMPCGGPRTNCQPARRVTWDTCSWRDEDGCPEGCTTETCQGCYEMGRGKIGPC